MPISIRKWSCRLWHQYKSWSKNFDSIYSHKGLKEPAQLTELTFSVLWRRTESRQQCGATNSRKCGWTGIATQWTSTCRSSKSHTNAVGILKTVRGQQSGDNSTQVGWSSLKHHSQKNAITWPDWWFSRKLLIKWPVLDLDGCSHSAKSFCDGCKQWQAIYELHGLKGQRTVHKNIRTEPL